MIIRGVLALLLLSAALVGCGFSDRAPKNVVVNVITEEDFHNSSDLYIRIGREAKVVEPSKFINRSRTKGGGWYLNGIQLPSSGQLRGLACLPPSLIGFVDVGHSDEEQIDPFGKPQIQKHIELVKANKAELSIASPQDGVYHLKEYSDIELPQFRLVIDGKHHNITALCSVNYSHSPHIDYGKDFEIKEGQIILDPENMLLFQASLNTAIKKGNDETRVTIMGFTEVNGQSVGFTASTSLSILSEL